MVEAFVFGGFANAKVSILIATNSSGGRWWQCTFLNRSATKCCLMSLFGRMARAWKAEHRYRAFDIHLPDK